MNKGIILADLGKSEEAIALYDKAISLDPNFLPVYNNKGCALVNLRRYEEAIICFDHVINLNPQYAHAFYNKGNALKGLGMIGEANVCYEKAASLDPNLTPQGNAWIMWKIAKKWLTKPSVFIPILLVTFTLKTFR